MYSVSLLPYEYRMLHQTARKKDISLLAAIVVMGVLAAVYLIITVAAAGKDAELDGLQAENSALTMQISKLEGLEALSNEASTLLVQAVLAYGSNPQWDSLIAEIGNSVPATIGLANMSMKYAGGTGECIIKGKAAMHQAVSDWIKDLEEISGIGEIKCKFSEQKEGDPSLSGSVEFELSFPLLPGKGYRLPQEVTAHE